MFSPRSIGSVRSPYKETREIPKGLGAKHEAEGVLEILPEFEAGLADVEGFSHLFVIWYEEPTLRRTFRGEYEVYCRRVRRWLPRLPGSTPPP